MHCWRQMMSEKTTWKSETRQPNQNEEAEHESECLQSGVVDAVVLTPRPFRLLATAQDTIKIGATEPLSGTFKDIGERYLEGGHSAAKVINESGGLLGKKVEVVPIDSELKPDVATRKAQAMILKDEVKFFCGGTGSSVGAAMSQLAEKENVIMFTYGMDAASMVGEKCNKNFFRPGGSTDGRSFALAQLIVNKGFKKVGIMVRTTRSGTRPWQRSKRSSPRSARRPRSSPRSTTRPARRIMRPMPAS